MPTFGQHETGQRLHLTGVGALYVLKSDPKKIIKVLQPPEGIWFQDQLREEVDAFLLRAKIQRAVAKSSKNWAPVHEAAAIRQGTEGSSGGGEGASRVEGPDYRASGAFLVMDRYERTVQSLIDGHVNLNNDDLRNVMSGVISGLRDIRKTLSRPHANLKAANILLANSADLAQAGVFISDPAADGQLTANSDKKEYSDLARLLYELVNLRPYQGGTVPRTRDWSELGPNGEDWRKLCNTLLDISQGGGTDEDRDLDKMLARIDKWRAKPRKAKVPMIAAAIVLLVILGGTATWWFTREKKIDFSQDNWEKLCLSYYSWFDNFADMDDATKKKYLSDPRYPAEAVRLLDAAKDLAKYKPQKISQTMQSAQSLASAPTDEAKTGYGPNYTKHGVDLIDSVSEALSPSHWPLLGQLDRTAEAYDKRGWTRPAAGIRKLIDSAKPPELPKTGDVAERVKQIHPVNEFVSIEKTVSASQTVTDIDASWQRITQKIDGVEKIPGKIPLLEHFKEFAEDLPRAQSAGAPPNEGTLDDVRALAQSFKQIDEALDKLAMLKDPPYDLSALAGDPAAQFAAGDKLTIDRFTGLIAIADRDYKRLVPDPRLAAMKPGSLQESKTDIDIITKANKSDAHLADLQSRHEALVKQIAALNKLTPISKNAAAIQTQVNAIAKSRETLAMDSESWSAPYKIKPGEYIAKQKSRISGGLHALSPAVETQWRTASENLLKTIEAAPDSLRNYQKFMDIEAKFKAIDAIYVDFDQKKIPIKVPGLSDVPPGDWRFAVASRVATVYREQTLADLMAHVKFSDGVPQVNDPAYLSFEKQRLAIFEQARQDTLAMIADFGTIQARLDHLDLLPDEPARGDKSWRELAGKWKPTGSSPLADPQIAEAVRPITDRTAALLELDGINDYATLVQAAMSQAPEIALTAWRKMGAVAINERLPVLKDEDDTEANLDKLFGTMLQSRRLDNQKISALKTEIERQRPIRWHRYADTLASADRIEATLNARAHFGGILTLPDDVNLAYDELLYQLSMDFRKNHPDAELKNIVRAFISKVRALPAAVSRDAAVAGLLDRMEKPLATTVEESSSAGAGPKLAGWTQETPAGNPDVRIFTHVGTSGQKHTLEFTRLQAGGKTIYLCTTEVSLGLFAYAVDAANCFADLDNTGKAAGKDHWFKPGGDPWDGPRVWKIQDNKFVPNIDWLFLPPTMAGKNPYPGGGPAKPAVTDPMQQITPWSAIYVSRLLGCRLPTSEEWNAAYVKFEGGAGAAAKDAWNLRGAGWEQQQTYAGKMAADGLAYPDAGIFLESDQLFAGITAEAAKPWQSADLAKLNPSRVNANGGVYPTSQIWFRGVGMEPGVRPAGDGSGIPHDLVGNVAEYILDGPGANAVIKDTRVSVADVDTAVASASNKLYVVGGSSLSPPQTQFNKMLPVDPTFAQTLTGFSDVGFRLAYTAPIDSITDVLAQIFPVAGHPPYLPAKTAR
jgi:hypothetical protein